MRVAYQPARTPVNEIPPSLLAVRGDAAEPRQEEVVSHLQKIGKIGRTKGVFALGAYQAIRLSRLPARALPERVFYGSKRGGRQRHEGNLDAHEGNHGWAKSLVVEWHDAAQRRDDPPTEERRPDVQREVVDVTSPPSM